MNDAIPSEPGLFADCWSEEEFAAQRKVVTRTLRAERQAGLGPPYLKDGRRVYYPISKAREWLAQKVCSPAREPQAPTAHHGRALKPRVAATRRRVLATAHPAE
jgi:hypothetical protein